MPAALMISLEKIIMCDNLRGTFCGMPANSRIEIINNVKGKIEKPFFRFGALVFRAKMVHRIQNTQNRVVCRFGDSIKISLIHVLPLSLINQLVTMTL